MPPRRKPVPPAPDDLNGLFAVREAVPLTPEPESSCCVRLVDRTAVSARDDAKTWLAFLRGLSLVRETDRGYVRTRGNPDEESLAERFLAGVYGARELHDILRTAGPVDADAAFERFTEHVPTYERHRSEEWRQTWRGRVERLLEWGVLFGVFAAAGDGYRLSPRSQGGSTRSASDPRR